MKSNSRITGRPFHFLPGRIAALGLVLALFAISAATGQQPPIKDRVRATVEKTGWGADGSIVISVRIHAMNSQDLSLSQRGTGKDSDLAFSLGGSYLIDSYTGSKFLPLQQLPMKPYYGPMEVLGGITRGGWIGLGVAFPAPPIPPPSRDGQPQPYKLMLYVPLDAAPVLVTIPPKQ